MAINDDLKASLAGANTRDQLYEVPDVFQIPLLFNKEISCESLSTRVTNQNIYDGTKDSYIVEHPQNGVLGSTAIGIGTTSVYWGNHHGTLTLKRVTNPGNTWKDFIRDTYHWDTTNSTATVDTTNHKIIF